jgi:hypothetical protein
MVEGDAEYLLVVKEIGLGDDGAFGSTGGSGSVLEKGSVIDGEVRSTPVISTLEGDVVSRDPREAPQIRSEGEQRLGLSSNAASGKYESCFAVLGDAPQASEGALGMYRVRGRGRDSDESRGLTAHETSDKGESGRIKENGAVTLLRDVGQSDGDGAHLGVERAKGDRVDRTGEVASREKAEAKISGTRFGVPSEEVHQNRLTAGHRCRMDWGHQGSVAPLGEGFGLGSSKRQSAVPGAKAAKRRDRVASSAV